jgi:hypothetical protein
MVDGQPMLANTTVELPEGTQLTARVVTTGAQPQLALVPQEVPEPEPNPVATALNHSLPQQQPLAEVLPRLLNAMANQELGKTLPPAVREGLADLAKSVPELASLGKPGVVASAIGHAGLQLENSLAKIVASMPEVGASHPAIPKAPPQLPGQDLKWQLMNLREAILVAVHQQHTTASPAATPQTEGYTAAATLREPVLTRRPVDSGLADLPELRQSGPLDGMLDDVNAGLARITTHQLQSSNASQVNAFLVQLELPVQTGVGVDTLNIEVRDEQRGQKADAPTPFTVMLEVPVGELGKLRARIALAGERIAITTWSETPALRDLIARHIGELDQALSANGFDVSPSVVGELTPAKTARTGQGPLIDVEV